MILGQNCSTIYHSTIDNSKKSINFVISSRMKISNAPPQGYVPRGFFMKRAIFFIDGFNLDHYHPSRRMLLQQQYQPEPLILITL